MNIFQVDALEQQHKELLKRQTALQNDGARTADRLAGMQACKSKLDHAIANASKRLSKAQMGPEVEQKMPPKKISQRVSLWMKECQVSLTLEKYLKYIYVFFNANFHLTVSLRKSLMRQNPVGLKNSR